MNIFFIIFFTLFLLSFKINFSKKVSMLLVLEGLLIIIIFLLMLNFSIFSCFLCLLFSIFMVLDSVLGMTLLILSSRSTSNHSSFLTF